jgi:hypothetical protein
MREHGQFRSQNQEVMFGVCALTPVAFGDGSAGAA